MIEELIPFEGAVYLPEDDCEEAFYSRFKDYFKPNDAAFYVWKSAWECRQKEINYLKDQLCEKN